MADMSYFDNLSVADSIVQGLEDAIAYKKGDKTKGRSVYVYLYTPEDIANIRKKYDLTQKGLGEVLDVSTRTVEAWETGVNVPSGPANKLLRLLDADNENKIIGMLTSH